MRRQFSIRFLMLVMVICAITSLIGRRIYVAGEPARVAAELNELGGSAEVIHDGMCDEFIESQPIKQEHVMGDESCEGLSFASIQDSQAFLAIAKARNISKVGIDQIATNVSIGRPDLSHLHHLAVYGATDKQICDLINAAPNLAYVEISAPTDSANKTIQTISNHKSLECVYLSNFTVRKDDIQQIGMIPNLNQLLLVGCTIDQFCLTEIQSFPQLSKLSLIGETVDDSLIQDIAPITQIKELNLTNSEVTDAGIKTLVSMQQLRELDLYGCRRITAACVDDLIKIKSLKHLSVLRTAIEEDPVLNAQSRLILMEWIL